MPSAVGKKGSAPQHDDIDNYDIGDLSDDPFRSPTPEPKKRKDPPQSGLGIDEEVSVAKRARKPRVKLDEDRLLGPAGIPTLQKRAGKLKLKGKGHEFSDAARLLSFYQLWLDDLFPKARFLDALEMVEKAGHKKKLVMARDEWTREPKATGEDGAEDPELMPLSSVEQPARPSTPGADRDIPDDADLYDATPRRAPPTVPIINDEPDPDDLDALMAEAAAQPTQKPSRAARDESEDDLDALIAEAEAIQPAEAPKKSQETQKTVDDDFAAEEAAMQEMDGLW